MENWLFQRINLFVLQILIYYMYFSELGWFSYDFSKFENCHIVPVCVYNRDYRLDPFSAASWHEPVLKVQHEPALMHSRSNRY